jgi:hypothetical protein
MDGNKLFCRRQGAFWTKHVERQGHYVVIRGKNVCEILIIHTFVYVIVKYFQLVVIILLLYIYPAGATEMLFLKVCYLCLNHKRYKKSIDYRYKNEEHVADSLRYSCHVGQNKQIEEYSQISVPHSSPEIHSKFFQVNIRCFRAAHRQSLTGLSRERPEFNPSA